MTPYLCLLTAILLVTPLRAQLIPARARTVGLRVISIDVPRRTRVILWYPTAVSSPAVGATLATYVTLLHDTSFAIEATAFAHTTLGEQAIAAMLATSSRVVIGAAHAPGRYPLVLLGNGFGPPYFVHWALAEYLAARGYVVAAMAGSEGEESRHFDLSGVTAIAEDMRSVLTSLSDLPFIDACHIGLVGWSVGGLAQAFVAATTSHVGAIVSLDGGTGYAYGAQMLDSATWLDRARFTIAYLHLTGDGVPSLAVPTSTFFYDSLARGPAYLLHVKHLTHSQFTSLGVLAAWMADSTTASPMLEEYAYVARTTAWMLDTYVTRRSNSTDILNEHTSASDRRSCIDRRAGVSAPPWDTTRRAIPGPLCHPRATVSPSGHRDHWD
jgi:hypothetical protein